MDTQFKQTILVKSNQNVYYLISWYNTRYTSKLRFLKLEDDGIGDSQEFNFPYRRIIYSKISDKLRMKNLNSYQMRKYREIQTDTSYERDRKARKYLRKYQNWKPASRWSRYRAELPELEPPSIELEPSIRQKLMMIERQVGNQFETVDIENYLKKKPDTPLQTLLESMSFEEDTELVETKTKDSQPYNNIVSLLRSEFRYQKREFMIRSKSLDDLDNLVTKYINAGNSSWDRKSLKSFLATFSKIIFAVSRELEVLDILPSDFNTLVTEALNHPKLSYHGDGTYHLEGNNGTVEINTQLEMANFDDPQSKGSHGYNSWGSDLKPKMTVIQDEFWTKVSKFWTLSKLREETIDRITNHLQNEILPIYLNPTTSRMLRGISRYRTLIEQELDCITDFDKKTEKVQIIGTDDNSVVSSLVEQEISRDDPVYFYLDPEDVNTDSNYSVIKLNKGRGAVNILESNIFPKGVSISFDGMNFLTTIYQNCKLITQSPLKLSEFTIYLDLGFRLSAGLATKYNLNQITNTNSTIDTAQPLQLLIEPDMRQRKLIFSDYWEDDTSFSRLSKLLVDGKLRNGEVIGAILYQQARDYREGITELVENLYEQSWLSSLKWYKGINRQMTAYLSRYGSEELRQSIRDQKEADYKSLTRRNRHAQRSEGGNLLTPLGYLTSIYNPMQKGWWKVMDTAFELNEKLFLKIRDRGATYPRDVNYGKARKTTPETSLVKPTLKRGELGKYADLYAVGVIFSIIDPSTKRSYLVRRINTYIASLAEEDQEFLFRVLFNLYLANVPVEYIANLLHRYSYPLKLDKVVEYWLRSPYFSDAFGIYKGNPEFKKTLRTKLSELPLEELFVLAYKQERTYSFNATIKGRRRSQRIPKGRSDYAGITSFKHVKQGTMTTSQQNFVADYSKEYFKEIMPVSNKRELEVIFGKYPDKFLQVYDKDYQIETARLFSDLLISDLEGEIQFIKSLNQIWQNRDDDFKREVMVFLTEYFAKNNVYSGIDAITAIKSSRYYRRRRRNRLISDFHKLTPFFLSTPPKYIKEMIIQGNNTWKLFYVFYHHEESILPRYPFVYYYLQLPLTNLLRTNAQKTFKTDYMMANPPKKIRMIFDYIRAVPEKWHKIYQLQDIEMEQEEFCKVLLDTYKDMEGIDEINNFIGSQLLLLEKNTREELLQNQPLPEATGYLTALIKFSDYRDLIGFDELNYYLNADNSMLIRNIIDIIESEVDEQEVDLLIACLKSHDTDLQDIAKIKLGNIDNQELLSLLSLDPHVNSLQFAIDVYEQMEAKQVDSLLQLVEHPESTQFAYILVELIDKIEELQENSLSIVISYLSKILLMPMHDRLIKSTAIDTLVELATNHERSRSPIIRLLTVLSNSDFHVDKQSAILGIAAIEEE